ncbi:MAG: hypothetical protein MJ252_01840, partial [archaeon]|nr:hypothetical protein [archaeon]
NISNIPNDSDREYNNKKINRSASTNIYFKQKSNSTYSNSIDNFNKNPSKNNYSSSSNKNQSLTPDRRKNDFIYDRSKNKTYNTININKNILNEKENKSNHSFILENKDKLENRIERRIDNEVSDNTRDLKQNLRGRNIYIPNNTYGNKSFNNGSSSGIRSLPSKISSRVDDDISDKYFQTVEGPNRNDIKLNLFNKTLESDNKKVSNTIHYMDKIGKKLNEEQNEDIKDLNNRKFNFYFTFFRIG